MSHIRLTQVLIHNNPSSFNSPFIFDISFECVSPIKEDLEWKVIYVGSADNEKNDQVLDSILLGPVAVGQNQFVFEVDPPDANKIPKDDLLGVTVVFLICAYKGEDFIRVGYYVNNDYFEQELKDNPPETPDLSKIQRNVMDDKPVVTGFPIQWN
ncbi:hypothetical protein ACTFIW_002040 [Dictyostelium discoideum]|uniref:Histone chaperone asf1 n=1 Tax=Dictyostelium discoideum TaxID=44689 RepID=ASF1_DICDI|nr:anti-silencing protein 1 [Dictyostelium discoideum AX4]Q54N45.1 RecName: Full=Histone chaperone asf1; AltName: Full=Anti-silencing function protein 1 homolog [Dictyostelium discoideum]EAL64594.1 anti-silencing protein 1 [Dictyostelium discoideum AX4]|eukprot:XP_638098.1 anti-silencing protein 1 [Dictyostelium discoideum AX4]